MGKIIRYSVFLCALIVSAMPAYAVIDIYQFDNAQQQARYEHLIDVLRCPKCQNQNLADSDAAIAQDLRQELHKMIVDNEKDDDIIQYMVQRYGNFVLYQPPMDKHTLVLWLGPVVLLLLGLFVAWRLRKAGAKNAPSELSEEESQRLAELLEKYGA